MSAIKKTNQIVDEMKTKWAAQVGGGGFYFGYPQEVDNIHSKTLPLMVVNPPEITISSNAWNSNTISNDSTWNCVVYDVLPSQYNVTDDLAILDFWDTIEDKTLSWFYDWWYSFESIGVDFVSTSPIQITRIKEASNDRLLALKVTFGFNFFRYCKQIT